MKKTEKKINNESIQEEDNVDKLFNELKNGKMEKILRKNKILSYLKIILISVISAVVVLFVAYVTVDSLNFKYCQSKQMIEEDILSNCYKIGYPNRYIGEDYRYNNLFNGEIEITTYKNLDGKILYAGAEKRVFGIFRSRSGLFVEGMVSQQLADNGISSISTDLKNRQSSVYGLRYMTFYYPYVEYKNGINDMQLLSQIPNDKIVEIGLSFDKKYSLNDARMFIPENLGTFYWVDDKSSNEKESLKERRWACGENDIHGIKLLDEFGQIIKEPEKNFIRALTSLKNIEFYKDIYKNIAGSDGSIDESDIYVQGAVLVGSPDNIAQLKDKPFIKYATLGSVVDKY